MNTEILPDTRDTEDRNASKSTKCDKSAVARLRVITGLKEEEFAQLCGLNLNSYKSLIQRQHNTGKGLSREVAYRIAAVTGAPADKLLSNQFEDKNHCGEYQLEDFLRHSETSSFPFHKEGEQLMLMPEEKDDYHQSNKLKLALMNCLQAQFDEIWNQLEFCRDMSFLSRIFYVAYELEGMAERYHLSDPTEPKNCPFTDLVDAVHEKVPKDVLTLAANAQRLKSIEHFADLMKQSKKLSAVDRKKNSHASNK